MAWATRSSSPRPPRSRRCSCRPTSSSRRTRSSTSCARSRCASRARPSAASSSPPQGPAGPRSRWGFGARAPGGPLAAAAGPGTGFAIDAASFAVSALFVLAIRPRPGPKLAPDTSRSAVREIREGLRYVRSKPWLWATLAASGLSIFAFFGPLQVLLPFELKNDLGVGPGTFGAVLAAGGVGSIVAALLVGQRGLPRRVITWMYVAWSLATLEVALFAIADIPWQFMAIAFAGGAFDTLGNIAWGT